MFPWIKKCKAKGHRNGAGYFEIASQPFEPEKIWPIAHLGGAQNDFPKQLAGSVSVIDFLGPLAYPLPCGKQT